jgi:predicted nucleotidyltransferase
MKVTGIIVEYNPLHNGHVYHIEQTREESQCDVLIAVMSSHFTQRGEPTIVDKFTRTRWALDNGVDLVVELPFVFGVQSADIFAKTSVSILHALGVTDIYFGSESGTIAHLEELAEILDHPEYNDKIQDYLQAGDSYPTASDKAMKDIFFEDGYNQPNNILGIQYIRSGQDLSPKIQFHTIQRINAGYYEELQEDQSIQSATSIRKLVQAKQPIDSYVPSIVANELPHYTPVTYNDFTQALAGILHRAHAEELHQIYHVTEGLEHRIKKITNFTSIDDFLEQLITRRYTHAKLQRMIAHILCNVTYLDVPSFDVPYLRILGMNDQGRAHLSAIKKTVNVPFFTKIKEGLHPYLDIELRVTKIYNMATSTDLYKQEFEPVIF